MLKYIILIEVIFMYRYINGEYAYDLLNYAAYVILMVSSLFYYKLKQHVLGLHSKRITYLASKHNLNWGQIAKFITASVEALAMAFMLNISTIYFIIFGMFLFYISTFSENRWKDDKYQGYS